MRALPFSIAAALALAACGAPPSADVDAKPSAEALASDPSDAPFAQIGGSNFIAYDTAGYRANGDIFANDGFRSPIAQYHLDPQRVRDELHAMYANGQRTIALFLWYAPEVATGPATSPDSGSYGSRGFVTSSAGNALMPQHQENLRNLIADVVATGFREVQFRFAGMGSAYPIQRATWDEGWYQSNWNFVASTTKLVNAALAGTGVPVVYDLQAELGGVEDQGVSRQYAKRIWQDFSYTFPTTRTYGFTVIPAAPGTVAKMIRMFDETGRRPSEYAVDVYDKPGVPNLTTQLGYVADDLAAAGDARKPVLVQETFANDYDALREIVAATSRVNVRAVCQWPLDHDHPDPVTTMDYAASYHAFLTYLPAPTIDAAGTGCSDGKCLWMIAENAEAAATVDVRARSTGTLLHSYSGSALTRTVSGGKTTITLRLATTQEIFHLGFDGLTVYVVNPNAAKWSNGAGVP